MQESKQSIHNNNFKVVLRCKPLIRAPYQIQNNIQPVSVLFIDEQKKQVSLVDEYRGMVQSQAKKFIYDKIFGPEDDQQIIYSQLGYPLVESVLQGYHGTVFAYGQTGSGKTYTMEGKEDTPEERGIIPRACQHIFDHIEANPQIEYIVRVSHFQIYNESIYDLISQEKNLQIRQKQDSEVFIENLSNYVVTNKEEVFKKMKQGLRNKVIRSTLLNSCSSRSHTIFQILISRYDKTNPENVLNVGTLNFVDLAGTEKLSQTGATGLALQEGIKINLSLSTLGNVMAQLTNSKSKHIPYRDSKLTRILQNSLGGNSKTFMIATVSQDSYCHEETLSTLRYAERAKAVTNIAKINKISNNNAIKSFREEYSSISQSRNASASNISDQSQLDREEKKSVTSYGMMSHQEEDEFEII